MSTLYIRDVPETVAQTLRCRAQARGQSLSAFITEQLTEIAARPGNDEMVARLRELDRRDGATTDQIVEALAESRR